MDVYPATQPKTVYLKNSAEQRTQKDSSGKTNFNVHYVGSSSAVINRRDNANLANTQNLHPAETVVVSKDYGSDLAVFKDMAYPLLS